ncbi:transcription factor HES-1-like isoform X2 [Protopterus annectens]|nr:transcription factor HES-1-like isoform X2 [Protopterus annectens]
MVDAYNLDQSKLEKADILEITVQHMETMQRSTLLADTRQNFEAQQRYSSGYIQCMHEVHGLLLSCQSMEKSTTSGLLNHLLQSLPQTSSETCPVATSSSAPVFQPLQCQPTASMTTEASVTGCSTESLLLTSSSRLPQDQQNTRATNRDEPFVSSGMPTTAVSTIAESFPSQQFLPPTETSMWRPW